MAYNLDLQDYAFLSYGADQSSTSASTTAWCWYEPPPPSCKPELHNTYTCHGKETRLQQ